MSSKMTVEQASQHSALVQADAAIGNGKILQWIITYGLPLLLKVLPLIAPFLGTLPQNDLIKWVEGALAALKEGKPMPPLPTPAPKVG